MRYEVKCLVHGFASVTVEADNKADAESRARV